MLSSKQINKLLLTLVFLSVSSLVSAKENADSISSQELYKLGEKLFTGKLKSYTGESCASCHFTFRVDTFTWIPNIKEIAPFADSVDFSTFQELILYPYSTEKLMEVHVDYDFTDSELQALQYFVTSHKNKELPKKKRISIRQVLLTLSLLILILAVVDLFSLHSVKYYQVHYILIAVTSIYLLNVAITSSRKIKHQVGYAPQQEIKFSHNLHVKQNKIDCKYCHSEAYKYSTGGFPTLQVCYTCHLVIREGSNSGGFELNKLHTAWENKQEIEWTKINNLPDHVRFHHGIHVSKAQISCEECHGDVSQKHRLDQPFAFTMKFCLDCHKQTQVSHYNFSDSISFKEVGGWDCVTCHQ